MEWASSLMSAVKNAVVKTIAAESTPVAVPQLSSKRPPNKKNLSTKQKRKAQVKKKKASQKSTTNKDDSSVESSEDAKQDSDKTHQSTQAQEEDSAAFPENGVLSAPASEEDETVGKRNGSELEEETETQTKPEFDAFTQAQLIRKERNRRKALKCKEKAKQKKALLATSLVRTLPKDHLEGERENALAGLVAALDLIECLSPSNVRLQFQHVQKALDDFLRQADDVCKELNKKTPKPETRNVTSEQLKLSIQEIEFSPERDESALSRRVIQLQDLISYENQKAWLLRVQALREKAEGRKKANVALLNSARERETRERILSRVKGLKEAANCLGPTDETVTDDTLHMTSYDLQPAQQAALFQPYNLLPRMERRMHVVIETVTRTLDTRRGNKGSRVVNIWGLEPDVERCVNFLNKADLSGKQRQQYDRRQMGAIIGRSGAGLSALEDSSKSFVHIVGSQEVVVFGPPDAAKIVFDHIEKAKLEAMELPVSFDFPIQPIVGRAITSLHRVVLQSIETAFKGRIIVIASPSDGSEPRVIVRARADQIEAAKKRVKTEIVDAYTVLEFEAPPRALNRLLVAPRNVSELAASRRMYDEFKSFRETLALFVKRSGRRSEEGEEEATDSSMTVVCHKVDQEMVQSRIKDLIERASYTTFRIPIEREQLRHFTLENRALIEATTKCHINVISHTEETFLIVMGSEAAIDRAKDVVAEMIAREARVESFHIDEPEVINALFRNRASQLRELELRHNVSITLYRDEHLCKIVGDAASITECARVIHTMCEEHKIRRSLTDTLEMNIETRHIRTLVGRSGATINGIKQVSQVDSIHIPSREEIDDGATHVKITIKGLRKSVNMAQDLIERLLSARSKALPSSQANDGDDNDAHELARNPYMRPSRGRGIARYPRQDTETPVSNYDENFPCLPSELSKRTSLGPSLLESDPQLELRLVESDSQLESRKETELAPPTPFEERGEKGNDTSPKI